MVRLRRSDPGKPPGRAEVLRKDLKRILSRDKACVEKKCPLQKEKINEQRSQSGKS